LKNEKTAEDSSLEFLFRFVSRQNEKKRHCERSEAISLMLYYHHQKDYFVLSLLVTTVQCCEF